MRGHSKSASLSEQQEYTVGRVYCRCFEEVDMRVLMDECFISVIDDYICCG